MVWGRRYTRRKPPHTHTKVGAQEKITGVVWDDANLLNGCQLLFASELQTVSEKGFVKKPVVDLSGNPPI